MEEILVPAKENVVPNLGSNLSNQEIPTDLIQQIFSDFEQSKKISGDTVKKLEESVLSSQPLQNKLSPLKQQTITPLSIKINGTIGNDFLVGSNNPDEILASDGNDIVVGRGNNDLIFGGFGKDLLSGGDGNDIIEGEAGDDQIFGGLAEDILRGGDGKDILIGTIPNSLVSPGISEFDKLIGGAGADTFVLGDKDGIFYTKVDTGLIDFFATIEDFIPGEDVIQLKQISGGSNYQLARGIDPSGKVFTDIKVSDFDIIARVQGVELFELNSGFTFV
jgi:Ca2+-binding RTX toxin-like protein